MAVDRATVTDLAARSSYARHAIRLMLVLMAGLSLLLGQAGVVAAGQYFGGTKAHHCACGMKPGTCGCPECARIEAAKLAVKHTEVSDEGPVLTPLCERDRLAQTGDTRSFPQSPQLDRLVPLRPGRLLQRFEPVALCGGRASAPETPPPRTRG